MRPGLHEAASRLQTHCNGPGAPSSHGGSTARRRRGGSRHDRDHRHDHRRPRAQGPAPRDVGARATTRPSASEVIAELGPVLVAASGIGRGDRVLDVAAGSGNAAVPAALTGAEVVASDLTPELFAAGREFAARRGVELTWEEGDAEALPYPDGEFDVVLSCVGVMFAPHHQQAADELVRVCRPGGTIGLISWTPTGFVGELFRTMKPYVPPPPPGAQPAAAVGRRGARPRPARRPGHRRRRPAADADRRPVRHARGVAGLLEGGLRADDRRLPQHRRRPRAGRGAGPRPRRAGRPVRPRHRDRP